MIRLKIISLILLCWSSINCLAADGRQTSFVPTPLHCQNSPGTWTAKQPTVTLKIADPAFGLIDVAQNDLRNLWGLSLLRVEKNADIEIAIDTQLKEEEYQLTVDTNIKLKGGSYRAVVYGWTTLMQTASVDSERLQLPKISISDCPHSSYRGVLIDLARRFHSIESLLPIIDLCRWYKINYIQLHLNDDQLCVFPSKAFPEIATKGKSYTREELALLVQYAQERGIAIIPELDAPAHSESLRRAYPQIFGEPALKMIDVASDSAIEACKIIAGEMMEVFHTSPYFHIGADEVNLSVFENREQTKNKIKEKGYESAHDLYLSYIVEMNEFVKSKGRKTLMWESFKGTGSSSVTIPNDITVFAWETMYQTPDSLIDNGYHIINAAWRPCYITSTERWTTKQIYDWNMWRWEHFLDWAPAWNPIQLDENMHDKVIGGQMCSWDMAEEMEIPGLAARIPALMENLWNPYTNKDYEAFHKRYLHTDSLVKKLMFPAEFHYEGLSCIPHERFFNRENYFSDTMSISVLRTVPGCKITYSTDGSVPKFNSKEFPATLTFTESTLLKLSIFDNQQNKIGFHTALFEKRPLSREPEFIGHQNDNNNLFDRRYYFSNKLKIKPGSCNGNLIMRYTTDGSVPTALSPVHNRTVTVSEGGLFTIACFNEKGKQIGEPYRYLLIKQPNKK